MNGGKNWNLTSLFVLFWNSLKRWEQMKILYLKSHWYWKGNGDDDWSGGNRDEMEIFRIFIQEGLFCWGNSGVVSFTRFEVLKDSWRKMKKIWSACWVFWIKCIMKHLITYLFISVTQFLKSNHQYFWILRGSALSWIKKDFFYVFYNCY